MLRRTVQFFAANTFISLPLWVPLIGIGLLAYIEPRSPRRRAHVEPKARH